MASKSKVSRRQSSLWCVTGYIGGRQHDVYVGADSPHEALSLVGLAKSVPLHSTTTPKRVFGRPGASSADPS